MLVGCVIQGFSGVDDCESLIRKFLYLRYSPYRSLGFDCVNQEGRTETTTKAKTKWGKQRRMSILWGRDRAEERGEKT